MYIFLRVFVVVVLTLLLPAAVGAARGFAANSSLYAPLTGAAADAAIPASAASRAHDPAKPTAVVVIGAKGAEVSDVLAPFEILATTGAFNVYTAAPERRPLPLTGGLHLVPDFTFAELAERMGGGAADVVVVPALPDVDKPSTRPVTDWLRRQSGEGALMVGVCSGARVLASAGLLDGRNATSHWARINDMEQDYPDVNWVRGTRYVDTGDVITTGGLLSNIDGTLRVVERLINPQTAQRTAATVGWRHYSSESPASMPVQQLGPDAVLKPLNAAYRRTRTGVVLTDGVGELELAAVFDTHSGQSFATRTVAVAASHDAVSSRHGLTFVPTSDLHTVGDDLDRLIVPGAAAAQRQDPDLTAHATGEHGLSPTYLHERPGFPYDAALRDVAATFDIPTARWTAKVLEYPIDDLDLAGPAWPWPVTLYPLLLGLLGLAAVSAFVIGLRRRGEQQSPRPDGSGARRQPARQPASSDLPVGERVNRMRT